MNTPSLPSGTGKRAAGHDSIPKILASAMECIARCGYEGASTQEIAAAAGVSKSLLHYHFASKEDLLIRVVSELAGGIAHDIRARVDEAAPPVRRLFAMAADLYDLLLGDPIKTAFLTEMYATAVHNERVRAELRQYRQAELALIEGSLTAALEPVRDHLLVPIADFAAIVQTLIIGMSAQSNLVAAPAELRARWNVITEGVLSGLVAPLLIAGGLSAASTIHDSNVTI